MYVYGYITFSVPDAHTESSACIGVEKGGEQGAMAFLM